MARAGHSRIDRQAASTGSTACEKATGAAKYAYDINLPKMLIARALGCPHAHCKIKSIDVTPAIGVPGVVNVQLVKKERRTRSAGKAT